MKKESENRYVGLARQIGPWLPLVAVLWAAFSYYLNSRLEHALKTFAESQTVSRDQYIENQQTQDRRLDKLEERAEKQADRCKCR